MTKSKAIHRFTQSNLHLCHRDVEVIVTAILDEIASALLRDDRVELRGSWENRHLGAALPRRLRHPGQRRLGRRSPVVYGLPYGNGYYGSPYYAAPVIYGPGRGGLEQQ